MIITEQELRERLRQFYAPFEIELWLDAPHPLLSDRSPRQMIDGGDIAQVERVIAQLEDGSFL
jgi:uncharacterized protein (DUF2384 family)